MTPELRVATRAAGLNQDKQRALLRMLRVQMRSRIGYEILSTSEIRRLHFARWLYQSGYLAS